MRKITTLLFVVSLFVVSCTNNQAQRTDSEKGNQDAKDEKLDEEKKDIIGSFVDLEKKYKSYIDYMPQSHNTTEYTTAESEFQSLSDRIDQYNATLNVLYGSHVPEDKVLQFPHNFKERVFNDPKYFREVYSQLTDNRKKEELRQQNAYSNNGGGSNSSSGTSYSSGTKTCCWCGKTFTGDGWTVSAGEPVQSGSTPSLFCGCSRKCAIESYNSQRR